jgi:hypothetical protein
MLLLDASYAATVLRLHMLPTTMLSLQGCDYTPASVRCSALTRSGSSGQSCRQASGATRNACHTLGCCCWPHLLDDRHMTAVTKYWKGDTFIEY